MAKESVFQEFKESLQFVKLIQEQNEKYDEERRQVLRNLEQAYKNNDKDLVDQLEQELKKQYEILETRRKIRDDAEMNVFQPALNKVLAHIDKKCGYTPRDTNCTNCSS